MFCYKHVEDFSCNAKIANSLYYFLNIQAIFYQSLILKMNSFIIDLTVLLYRSYQIKTIPTSC
jgi:hypothetical protein